MTRAGEAFGRLAGAQVRTEDPPVTPRSRGAVASERQGVVARYTVRLVTEEEEQALLELRRQLRELVGRVPSRSEIAAAAVVVGLAEPGAVAAIAAQIKRNDRRAGT